MIDVATYLLFFIQLFVYYLLLKSIIFYFSFKINPLQFLSLKNTKEFFLWQGMFLVLLGYGVLIFLRVGRYSIGKELTFLNTLFFTVLGIVLTLLGFVIMATAHQQMGQAWRMGIDAQQKTMLVEKGLYSWSRNPIYVAIVLQALGLVLLLKTWLAMILFLLLFISVFLIIKTEEQFLIRVFGKKYGEYRKRVRRFF